MLFFTLHRILLLPVVVTSFFIHDTSRGIHTIPSGSRRRPIRRSLYPQQRQSRDPSFFASLAAITNQPSDADADILPRELLRYDPVHDQLMTTILEGLATCTIDSLDNGINAIRMGNDAGLCDIWFAWNTIYARSFYSDLLAEIRSRGKVVLLGNPGTGKTVFQLYYLARLLNPAAFPDDPLLPPDIYGSTKPPEVVIRHIPKASTTVMFLKEKKAFKFYNSDVSFHVISFFDPMTTLYFFEPGGSKNEEPFFDCISTPTLATVSPDSSRYEKFVDNGCAKMLFMPLFNEDELITIGEDMIKQPGRFPLPTDDAAMRVNLYSKDLIHARFNKYNGIFRFVLPTDLGWLQRVDLRRGSAIDSADVGKILRGRGLEDGAVSDYVVAYKVPFDKKAGKFRFHVRCMALASQDVSDRLGGSNLLETTTLADKIVFMRQCYGDEPSWARTPSYEAEAPRIYESVIAEHLVSSSGVYWWQQGHERYGGGGEGGSLKQATQTPFHLKLKKRIFKGGGLAVPVYSDLEPMVLYRYRSSLRREGCRRPLPFCDFFYLDDDSKELVCIHTSLDKIMTSDRLHLHHANPPAPPPLSSAARDEVQHRSAGIPRPRLAAYQKFCERLGLVTAAPSQSSPVAAKGQGRGGGKNDKKKKNDAGATVIYDGENRIRFVYCPIPSSSIFHHTDDDDDLPPPLQLKKAAAMRTAASAQEHSSPSSSQGGITSTTLPANDISPYSTTIWHVCSDFSAGFEEQQEAEIQRREARGKKNNREARRKLLLARRDDLCKRA